MRRDVIAPGTHRRLAGAHSQMVPEHHLRMYLQLEGTDERRSLIVFGVMDRSRPTHDIKSHRYPVAVMLIVSALERFAIDQFVAAQHSYDFMLAIHMSSVFAFRDRRLTCLEYWRMHWMTVGQARL